MAPPRQSAQPARGMCCFAAVIFGLVALPAGMTAAIVAEGTALRDITLQLELDGKQVGQTKLTAGSRVLVFQDDGTRLKVGRSEAVAGWVNRDDITLDPAVERGTAAAQPTPLVSPPLEPARKNSAVRPAILSVRLSEKTEEEEKGGQCRRVGVAKLIDVRTAGVDDGNPQGAVLKTYAVLSTEFGPGFSKRREQPTLRVLELKPVANDSSAITYRHFQWNNTCSCCRKMKTGHLAGYYCEILSPEGEVLAGRSSDLNADEQLVLEQFLGRKPAGV